MGELLLQYWRLVRVGGALLVAKATGAQLSFVVQPDSTITPGATTTDWRFNASPRIAVYTSRASNLRQVDDDIAYLKAYRGRCRRRRRMKTHRLAEGSHRLTRRA